LKSAIASLIDQFGSKLAEWRDHPAQQAQEMFGITPDPKQAEALEAFPNSPRIAMQSCTGAGKTNVLGILGWNFLLTRPFPMIGATSISGANLKSNLWTELARLYERSSALKKLFEFTTTQIFSREHPRTWKLEARTWAKDATSEQIGTALRGVHADYVMWLADETGDYPPAILPTLEAVFSGSPKEAHIVQAGNPINRHGVLFRACVLARKLWRVIEMTADPDDPERTSRVSIEHAREQIEQYGRDNPWVRINILGLFPLSDVNALIGEDEVRAAMKRYYREFEIGDAPRVLGVDVARQGDDASAICRRAGVQVWPFLKQRGLNSTQGAGWVSRTWSDFEADGCFIDVTGGFGAGWYDQLLTLHRTPIGVQYAGAAHNANRYANKRAEMYFDAIEWIKRGGALPDAPNVLAALTQTLYTFLGDRMILEPKEMIKLKIGFSPDEADAFVQTFAEPIARVERAPRRGPANAASEYNPFAGMDRPLERG